MTGDSREQRIREIAYVKWEQAGWPNGDGVNFWLEAEHEILGSQPSESEGPKETLEASFPEVTAPPLKIAKTDSNSRKKAG